MDPVIGMATRFDWSDQRACDAQESQLGLEVTALNAYPRMSRSERATGAGGAAVPPQTSEGTLPVPLFKRRKGADRSGASDEAIADLARHGGVSLEEARRLAKGMSSADIAEFIGLEEAAAQAEADPPQPATVHEIERVFGISSDRVQRMAAVMSEAELRQVLANQQLPEGY